MPDYLALGIESVSDMISENCFPIFVVSGLFSVGVISLRDPAAPSIFCVSTVADFFIPVVVMFDYGSAKPILFLFAVSRSFFAHRTPLSNWRREGHCSTSAVQAASGYAAVTEFSILPDARLFALDLILSIVARAQFHKLMRVHIDAHFESQQRQGWRGTR